MIGQTISHYRILEKLGEGGMGVVYKAEDTRLDRTVALKLLAPHLLQHSESRTRFVREAKTSATLEHPNICMVFEIDEVEGQTFLAMSFVDGDSLREKIERRPLKLEEALDLAIQTAEGLQAAHENGIVHRDIKPGNVMLTKRGQVKILDFGLAQLGKLTRITESGTTLGTPAYMSPEQVEGKDVDHRADIWSLGVVFYEMITGRLPFEGDNQQAISHKILYEEPEPPTALRGRLPLELDRIVEKALAKDPADRYQHADDLIVDLRKLKRQSESGIVTQTAQAVPAPPTPIWKRRSILTAVALVVLAAGLAWYLRPNGTAPAPEAVLKAIPLTSYPGLETHPTLSPDGTQVAFRWNGPDRLNWDIYAKIIGPQESRQRLTTDPAEDYSPAWSPDGTSIAFLRDLGETKAGVFVVPARGGAERKLVEIYDILLRWRLGSGPDPHLAWTPDSESLIVSGGTAPDMDSIGFFLVSPATSELRRIGKIGGVFPVVSPDGRKLAFRWNYNLHVMPLSDNYEPTGEAVRISEKEVGQGILWGPDSQELFFAADGRLWRINASGGGEPQIVQSVPGPTNTPVVSHQRSRLVYSAGQGRLNLWQLDLARSGQPQRQPVRLGASSMEYDVSPRCSPDGKRIAFESGRGGHPQIYACDSDGRNLVQLTSSKGAYCPTWSPDGKRIAFLASVQGPAETGSLHIMNADGSGLRRLTETFGFNPSWSHDGEWIYYGVGTMFESEVWKVPAEGGTPIQLTSRAEAANGATPQEAWDGQHVYFVKGDGVSKVPVDGGEEIQVLDSVHLRNYAVTRDGIYFIPIPKPGDPWSVQFWSDATGTTSNIAALDHRPAQGMSAPLDGRYAVVTLREMTSDLKLVERFTF